MPGKIEILFFQNFKTFSIINAQVIEEPVPELDMIYAHTETEDKWQIINFGFQPSNSTKEGIYAITIKPLSHTNDLKVGDVLEHIE
jgi:hypothetical protein